MLEAIAIVERLTGRSLRRSYSDTNRSGDHIWWVSDIRKFSEHYSGWNLTYTLDRIIEEIHEEMTQRLSVPGSD